MKPYKEIVHERYDTKEASLHLYDNQYALINPVGFYGHEKVRRAFFQVFNRLRAMGVDLPSQTILDVGCGTGEHSRFFAELVGSTKNITGLDLSTARIETARNLNPGITYIVGDLVNLALNKPFNIVTAIDIFLHFGVEAEIVAALENIYQTLQPNGIFIWYDVLTTDHFQTDNNADSAGYSRQQMLNFAREAGFANLFEVALFKRIGKYHSSYLCRKLPMWLVSLLENIIPGPPGNLLLVFQKKGQR